MTEIAPRPAKIQWVDNTLGWGGRDEQTPSAAGTLTACVNLWWATWQRPSALQMCTPFDAAHVPIRPRNEVNRTIAAALFDNNKEDYGVGSDGSF